MHIYWALLICSGLDIYCKPDRGSHCPADFFLCLIFFFFFFLVLVALGLCCGTQALHCFVHWLSLVVASGGYFLVSVCRLLIAAASLVAEQGSRPQ